MRDKIIALAETYRGLLEKKRQGCQRTEYVLETAPNIGRRRLEAIREILSLFPELDTVLVSLFPTEFRRGTYTDDLVPVARAFSGIGKEDPGKRPDAFCEDVDAFYMVEGFYLTDNGLGVYSHGAGLSLSPGYIPYARIKGYVRKASVDCFAYARGAGSDEEGGFETVETVSTGLEHFPFFLTEYRAFFQDLFALLQSEGRLFVGDAA